VAFVGLMAGNGAFGFSEKDWQIAVAQLMERSGLKKDSTIPGSGTMPVMIPWWMPASLYPTNDGICGNWTCLIYLSTDSWPGRNMAG